MTTGEQMAISDKLAQIQQRAAQLNAKTDDLNSTIQYIEKQLNGAGVEFWWTNGMMLGLRTERVQDQSGEHHKERSYFVLGYSKVGGEWCLAVQEWNDILTDERSDTWDELEVGEPIPLTRAARRIRIEAAEHLESFLDELDNQLAKMETAVDKANALASDRSIVDEHAALSHAAPGPNRDARAQALAERIVDTVERVKKRRPKS